MVQNVFADVNVIVNNTEFQYKVPSMNGDWTYGLVDGYKLIYNIRATGKIDNANNARVGILCSEAKAEI